CYGLRKKNICIQRVGGSVYKERASAGSVIPWRTRGCGRKALGSYRNGRQEGEAQQRGEDKSLNKSREMLVDAFGERIMALWWKFQGPSLADPITKNIRGAEITVLPSPYDIPEWFRTYVDPRENRWTVEFKYIDSEPLMSWQSSGNLRLWLGRN